MLRNSFILVIIHIFCFNSAFAASQDYNLIIQKQSAEINELTSRVNKLEQAVKALQNKTTSPEANTNPENLPGSLGKLSSSELNSNTLSTAEIDIAKAEYDAALALLKNGKFTEAEEKFSEFIQKHQKHKLQENAVFWHAESFYRQDNFNQAAINYLKSYKEYPKGSKAPDSLLKLSLSLGNLNKKKEACSILDKLESEFPNRPENSVKRAGEARNKFGCKK